jgi:hypothetical protein
MLRKPYRAWAVDTSNFMGCGDFVVSATQNLGHGKWVGGAKTRHTRPFWSVVFVACNLRAVIFECTKVTTQPQLKS